MDIYKRFGISTSFLDAIQTVTEKKHMDPVDPKQAKGAFKDRKDKDIDNDGDADKTDKYLHTRRNAITKAMSEKKKGSKDKIDLEPKIDDKGDMRGVQEAERRADVKMVKVRNPDGTMSFRKERPEINVEEVEEIEEAVHVNLPAKHAESRYNAVISHAKKMGYNVHHNEHFSDEKSGNKGTPDITVHYERGDHRGNADPVSIAVHKDGKANKDSTLTSIVRGKLKEEVEEIEELKKSTLGSYVKKRVKQLPDIEVGYQMAEPGRELKGYEKLKKKVNKGIGRAVDRMAKEEVEEIDELSKGTLASYAKKASRDARMKMAAGKDFERHAITSRKPEYKAGAKSWEDKYKSDARRREAGVNKAIDRLAKENADLTQEDIDFINELNKVDELDKKTLDKYSTRARFSSNPKHREGALKAMDKIKDKSKNEK